jgi:hypothetical protein
MRDLIVLLLHLITAVLRILQPGGLRSVIAESVLIKHQLLIVNRSRRRAPNLRAWDRLIAGLCSLWIRPHRLLRSAIAFKPSTLLNFHRALVHREYHALFSPKRKAKPGPKGQTLPSTLFLRAGKAPASRRQSAKNSSMRLVLKMGAQNFLTETLPMRIATRIIPISVRYLHPVIRSSRILANDRQSCIGLFCYTLRASLCALSTRPSAAD